MSTRQLLAAAALVTAAGCATDGDADSTATTPPTVPPAATTTAPPATLPDLELLPLLRIESDGDAELREFVSPALGGIRYSVSADHTPAAIHDTVIVFVEPPNPDIAGARSSAAIALVSQSVAGSAVPTVEAFLETIEGVADAVVQPTGDAIELFGHRLRGYEISNGAELEEPKLFSSARVGAPVDTEFAPFPYAVYYMADTPTGVLTASFTGTDEADARKATGALSTLLSTAELTGPGLDTLLPPGEAIAPVTPGPPPEPAELVDDGPPPLEALFSPVEPGAYQVPNVGRQLSIDIGDDWFAQPNFPGIVVLTAAGSIGPGDREIVMFSDVVEYLPIEAGPRRGGESTPVTGVEDLIENPPIGFTVSDIATQQLGTASATRFDLTSDPTATCALGDPCEAALVTTYGFVKPLTAGSDHRIWWIEHEAGPATVLFTMALDAPDFIERATALVATVEFE